MLKAYLGIDVSKKSLHVGTARRFLKSFDNCCDGHTKLLAFVNAGGHTSVVLEASGGYERLVCDRLQDAGIAVTVAQPSCVRHFAKSVKVLAKTDEIDSCVIARFGDATQPEPTPAVPRETRQLRALCDRRQQVIEDRVREQNRLESCADTVVAADISISIESLEKRECELDRQITGLLKLNDDMRCKAEVMKQQKGVGSRTAEALLAYLPELGTATRGQIAALAGLAPYAADSGDQRGQRRIHAGRATVRKALYMAAVTAARWCPVLSVFYQQLRARGKSYKTAIIACARKLLVRLNTVIKQLDQQPSSPIEPTPT